MKVKCLDNSGKALREYETKALRRDEFGKFGTSEVTQFNLEIGKEYLVMGMILFDSYLAYLVDDGTISACPCQLFEVIDRKLTPDWYFRTIDRGDEIYPFVQAIWGYYELCFDSKSYDKLIVEKEEQALRLYFRRKTEMEKLLEEF